MKVCNSCNKTGEFRADLRNKDGLQGICRNCQRQYQNEFNKEWNTLPKVRDYKRDRELTKFWPGSDSKQARKNYNAIFQEQSGCCAICDAHQNDLSMALAVDHCHETEAVRGLLCGTCNRMLGMARDNPETLIAASKYLNKKSLKLVANES